MSFRIPDEKVQEIRERADIVQVVGERVSLKKAGVRYVGLCPFHQEKTPSFGVHPGLGIFKCFGCGEGGDVISFVTKFEDRPFIEAARDLAARFGVQLPAEELSPRDVARERAAKEERAELFRLNALAAEFYHGLLLRDPAARDARAYLEGRKVSSETVRRFQLGFAPGGTLGGRRAPGVGNQRSATSWTSAASSSGAGSAWATSPASSVTLAATAAAPASRRPFT